MNFKKNKKISMIFYGVQDNKKGVKAHTREPPDTVSYKKSSFSAFFVSRIRNFVRQNSWGQTVNDRFLSN